MGKRKDDPTEEEKYQVWWRAIRLNREYKEWLNNELPIYLEDPLKYLENLKTEISSPDTFKKAEFVGCYSNFGDVHAVEFHEWWKSKVEFKENNPPVSDFAEWIGQDMKNQWTEMIQFEDNYQRIFNLDPKPASELADKFTDRYRQHLKNTGFLYLWIDITADIDELTKQFREHVLKRRKEAQNIHRLIKLHRIPIADRFMLEEIGTYLSIYDAWERSRKTSWETIFRETARGIYDRIDKSESRRREFHRFKECGRRLVENAARGTFPGNYNAS